MLPNDFKPYLIRSFYEYIADKNFTPYIHVFVNEFTQVPLEFVTDNAITLNIGMLACPDIEIKNHVIHFTARFSGKMSEVVIPMGHVLAIYARENTDLILTFPIDKHSAPVEKTEVLKENSLEKAQAGVKEAKVCFKIVKKKDKD
ncbi:MAG: ClpXP protease specificity-enhancing factor [Neisseriaceae bacterium]|nr:MAG: ClpXP protease specificity-enhancing factor [Neisseriaceae bacterium]